MILFNLILIMKNLKYLNNFIIGERKKKVMMKIILIFEIFKILKKLRLVVK